MDMRITSVAGLKANDRSIYYVGRKWGGWTASPLANPYHIGPDGTREEVLAKYRRWLWTELNKDAVLNGDNEVYHALRAIKADSILGCWCSPEPCHAEIIWKAWHWLMKELANPAAGQDFPPPLKIQYLIAHTFAC